MRQRLDERSNWRVGVGGATELIQKTAVLSNEHDARRRNQKRVRLRGDEVGPENDHMADSRSTPGAGRDWLARTRVSIATWRSCTYDDRRSFRMTRSTASCFIRQYL